MEEISLGLMAEGGESAFHLPNPPGEEFRRVFVATPNESSPLSMKIKLTEMHHGVMIFEGDPYHATLLVFEFRFESRLQKRRYQSASVTLEFFDKGLDGKRDPCVSAVAPDGMHWLHKTSYDKTTKHGYTGGLEAGKDMATAKAEAHWDVEYTKPARFKATLTGKATFGKDKYRHETVAKWTMEENKDEKDGIPSFLQTAVLLRRAEDRPFFATVKVESEVDIASAGRRSLPVTTDKDNIIDPVTFTPGKLQMRSNSAIGIKEHQLSEMQKLPIKSYFRVSLSQEDILTPPAPPAHPPASLPPAGSNLEGAKLAPTAAIETQFSPPTLSTEESPEITDPIATVVAPTSLPVVPVEGTHILIQPNIPIPVPLQTPQEPARTILTEISIDSRKSALTTALEAARAAQEAAEAAGQAAARAAEAATKAAEAVVKATEAVKAAVATVAAISALKQQSVGDHH